MYFQSYEANTGRILYTTFTTPELVEKIGNDGEFLIEGAGEAMTHYVDISQTPPIITERPATQTTQDKPTITAGSDDYLTISGLPQPCCVTIGTEDYDVPDGVLEWSSLLPGDYKILVTAWPYLDWEGKVTVLASAT